jgi:hypothetical protein
MKMLAMDAIESRLRVLQYCDEERWKAERFLKSGLSNRRRGVNGGIKEEEDEEAGASLKRSAARPEDDDTGRGERSRGP